jgi:hypothetical protein
MIKSNFDNESAALIGDLRVAPFTNPDMVDVDVLSG